MQRRFGDKFCPQKTKIYSSKTIEKSIISDKNKNFFKILKKSVALKVRLIYAISATSGRENVLFFKSVIGHFVDDDGF